MWQQELSKLLGEAKIMALVTNDRIRFVCARIPNDSIKEKIVSLLPVGALYEFVEEPKDGTFVALSVYFARAGVEIEKDDSKGRILRIRGRTQSDEVDPEQVWESVSNLVGLDGYFTRWELTLGDKTWAHDEAVCTAIARRGLVTRDRVISEEDLGDLHIFLESSKNLDEFLAKI
jgi:hypothetical protein